MFKKESIIANWFWCQEEGERQYHLHGTYSGILDRLDMDTNSN